MAIENKETDGLLFHVYWTQVLDLKNIETSPERLEFYAELGSDIMQDWYLDPHQGPTVDGAFKAGDQEVGEFTYLDDDGGTTGDSDMFMTGAPIFNKTIWSTFPKRAAQH